MKKIDELLIEEYGLEGTLVKFGYDIVSNAIAYHILLQWRVLTVLCGDAYGFWESIACVSSIDLAKKWVEQNKTERKFETKCIYYDNEKIEKELENK